MKRIVTFLSLTITSSVFAATTQNLQAFSSPYDVAARPLMALLQI